MEAAKSFSKKTFFITGLLMLIFTMAMDAGIYFLSDSLYVKGSLSDSVFVRQLLPASLFLWLIFTLLIWFLIKRTAAGVLTAAAERPEKKETPAEIKKREEESNKRLFLHLISILQRDARLVDFFFEKLDQFDDSQIGAAVRNIHENSLKTITKYLSPKPVVEGEEGQEVTIEKGFDPAAVKLTGNVTGEPPFKGLLRHKGWQSEDFELPLLSERENSLLIAPAEVEIR